ncbi:MAG TPA: hypothetical protein VED46_07915 [Alphaproteobacteria bacterium]|jgi:hypothetical protein|nr:hypothetical protein [Alphaproteobacteria bacterium]
MQEEQAREIARQAAGLAVQEVFYRLGLFVDEPDELREYRKDFTFIRAQRRTSEAIAHHVRRVAIGLGVTGLIYVIWQGVMLALGRGPQ